MTAPRARIVKAGEATATAQLLLPELVRPEAVRRVARATVEAKLAADRIEHEARAGAEAILARAREAAVAEGTQAREEARQQAHADAMAEWLRVRRAEQDRHQQSEAQIVGLAVVLAERLVGATLEATPARIAALAQGVLAEAAGARRATIEAHPADAEALRPQLAALGFAEGSIDVRDDPALARGALRLHTDVGTLDAQLAPRLERLAAALADVLAHVRS